MEQSDFAAKSYQVNRGTFSLKQGKCREETERDFYFYFHRQFKEYSDLFDCRGGKKKQSTKRMRLIGRGIFQTIYFVKYMPKLNSCTVYFRMNSNTFKTNRMIKNIEIGQQRLVMLELVFYMLPSG